MAYYKKDYMALHIDLIKIYKLYLNSSLM